MTQVVSERGRRGGGVVLSREDCLCPVCLEIYEEPVTLPCTHTFCKACFQESVDKATLCCPMCRKRVSNWARLHSKNKTLVNQTLWAQIQTSFPPTDRQETESVWVPRVSRPGEVRQEYEDQISKLTEERRALDEEEQKASEELIQRLLQEEQQQLQEESRRREEDERLARLISNQLNSAAVPPEDRRPADVPPVKKKRVEVIGHIEKFLCPRPPQSGSASSLLANKENFLLRNKLRPLPADEGRQTEEQHLLPSRNPLKRSSEPDGEEEPAAPRRPPLGSAPFVEAEVLLQQVAEREAELLGRRQQEDEDRRLAELLQKELDGEARRRETDRRKGSADAYQLRQNRGGEKEARRSRISRTSSSSSSSSSKQTTLTEMFPGCSR